MGILYLIQKRFFTFGFMNDWHNLSWCIDIVKDDGCYYVKVSDSTKGGDYYYHGCVFGSKEEMFSYVDWCDFYCDKIIHDLFINE